MADIVDSRRALGLPSLGPKTPDPDAEADAGYPQGEKPRGARRGDVIGDRYLVEGQIGRGGMGRVLQVRHTVLGKAFALKLPQRRHVTSPKVRERFYSEAKLASSLSHANICSVIDFGEDPSFGLFMVMELLEGVRLDYKLHRDGRLSTKVACDVIAQAAEALHYVHGCGIVHGDIKSENILLTRSQDKRRIIKLLDFGLARTEDSGDTQRIEGTPAYLAPERIAKQPPTPQSDIYALGILFWEVLVGERPFQGSNDYVFKCHTEAVLPPPSSRIDRPLDERADLIIARATAKNPGERHPDVASFLYELRTLSKMLSASNTRRKVESNRGGPAAPPLPRPSEPRLTSAGELFENTPMPLASVDSHGFVRVANRAFSAFLGQAGDATGILLSETTLMDAYSTLIDDIQLVAAERHAIRTVVELPHRNGRRMATVVCLSPSPNDDRLSTFADVYLAVHPLGPPEPSEYEEPVTPDPDR